MTSSSHRGARLAAIALATALVAGCTAGEVAVTEEEPSPGITDDAVRLGMSGPLTGPVSDAGLCAVAGLVSYLEAGNAAGGFEFGDGLTREVTLDYLDDGYDPATAQSNFRELVDDGVFAYVGGLGTSTNAAIAPIAAELEVPHVLLITGARAFSVDQTANPWTMGLVPSYYDEGYAFGRLLVERGRETTVATLAQDDAYGDDYVEGLEAAIEGSDVDIIAASTFDPSSASLDSQVRELAASQADALLSAVSVSTLQTGVLAAAQAVGWLPEVFLPSNTSTPATVVIPGNGIAYPAVYTTSFAKVPADPRFAGDADVVAYTAAFEAAGAAIAPSYTPHCAWSYTEGTILEEAFARMTAPTRSAFLAALRSLEGVDAPLLLDGVTVDTTDPTRPAIRDLVLERFDGQVFEPVD
jgi:ABC-type branched-chain amino acid transport systems, periplasmic component